MKVKKIVTYDFPDDYMKGWMEDFAIDEVNDYPIFNNIHDEKELETIISESDSCDTINYVISEEFIFESGDIHKWHEYFLNRYNQYKEEENTDC